MTIQCSAFGDKPNDLPVDNTHTDTTQREATLGVLLDTGNRSGSAQNTQKIVSDFYSRINGMTRVLPGSLRQVEAFLAHTLGMQFSLFGVTDWTNIKLTGAAQLRSNMVNISAESSGLLRNALLFSHTQEIRKIQKSMRRDLRAKGIPKRRIDEISQDILEHYETKLLSTTEPDTVKRQVAATRYRIHSEKMRAFGVTEDDMLKYHALAVRVHQAQSELAELAAHLGVRTDNRLEGIDYYTQQFTSGGERVIKALQSSGASLVLTPTRVRQSLMEGAETMKATVMRSRTTNLYTPTDMTLLVGHMLHHNQTQNLRKLNRLKTRTAKSNLKPTTVEKIKKRVGDIDTQTTKLTSDAQQLRDLLKKANTEQKQYLAGVKVQSRIDYYLGVGDELTPKQAETLTKLQAAKSELPEAEVKLKRVQFLQREYDATANKLAQLKKQRTKLQDTLNGRDTAQSKNLADVAEYTNSNDFEELTNFITNTLINDPVEFVRYLSQNYSDKFIHELVDAGLLGKLPMSSDEVWRFYRDAMPLPFKYRDEFLRAKPVESLNAYAASLGKAAGNSNVFSYISNQGVRDGWAVKSLSELPANVRADFVAADDDMFKLFSDNNIQLDGVKQLNGLYIHRDAASMLVSVLRMQSSPAIAGQMAQSFARIMQGVSGTALATLQSVFRAFLGASMFGFQASEMNPLFFTSYATNVVDLLAVYKSADVAPNWLTNNADDAMYSVGSGVTRREILEHLMAVRGLGGDVFGGVIDLPNASESFKSNIGALRNAAFYTSLSMNPSKTRMQNMLDNPTRFLSSYALGVISSTGEAVSAALNPIVAASQIADLAQRMSIIETLAHPKYGNGRGFASLDEAVRYTDQYSPTSLNNGSYTSFTNRYVMPFRTWAVFAPGAVIRHALRHPSQYMNYNRLWSLINELGDDDEPVLESDLNDAMLNGMPIRIGRDAEGNLVFFDVSSIDPSTGEFVNLRENMEAIGRALGAPVGSNREVLRSYDPRNNPASDFLHKQLQGMLIPNAVYEVVTGVDTFTGKARGLDTFGKSRFGGVEMPSRLALLLENVPLASSVNRVFFPSESASAANETTQGEVGNFLGVRVRVADVMRNTNSTLFELRTASGSAGDVLERSITEYYTTRDTLSVSERAEREAGLRSLAEKHTILQIELARLEVYAEQRGYNATQLERQLKKGSADLTRLESQLNGIPDPVITGRSEVLQRFMTEQGLVP
jgi:hypothetical protein